jgi:hypothetical protein
MFPCSRQERFTFCSYGVSAHFCPFNRSVELLGVRSSELVASLDGRAVDPQRERGVFPASLLCDGDDIVPGRARMLA